MSSKQVPNERPIYEIYLPKMINLSTIVYEILQFIKFKRRRISNGPSEVNHSLKSLRHSGEIRSRPMFKIPNGSLVWIGFGPIVKTKLKRIRNLHPAKLVLGPNLDIHNPYVRELLECVENTIFLVPSAWVQNYYVEALGIDETKIRVWAAGVDTDKWKPLECQKDLVVVYLKGNFQDLAMRISDSVKTLGFKVEILQYGTYSQDTYLSLLRKTKFAIFLINTESQGLAQFQAWSMDVPTLILAQAKYENSKTLGHIVPASSSPYLTASTGQFFDESDSFEAIHGFVNILDNFTPRRWVLANYSESSSAEEFKRIFH